MALGVAWAWLARDYDLIGEGGRLAAGSLPALAGFILVACGGVIVWSALRRHAPNPLPGETLASDPDESNNEAPPEARSKSRTVLVMLIASLALVTILGFSLSLALFTFLVLLGVERRSVRVSLGAAIALWAVGFVGFELLLGVNLPGPALIGV